MFQNSFAFSGCVVQNLQSLPIEPLKSASDNFLSHIYVGFN